MPIPTLPEIDFDPLKADQLGDMLVAELFFIAGSWQPNKILFPCPDVWVGANLLMVNGEMAKLSKYLNAKKRHA